MSVVGNVVIIRRNGKDGSTFPMSADICLFGRHEDCDIRVQLPKVAQEHAKLMTNEDETLDIENLDSVYETYVNEKPVTTRTRLQHNDIIKIADRYFRFEYPTGKQRAQPSPLKEIPPPKQRTPTPTRQSQKASRTEDSIDDVTKDNDVTPSRRRSVHFGPMLSPEFFDKRLPAKMPVKAGRTPEGRRRSSPGMTKIPKRSQIRRKTVGERASSTKDSVPLNWDNYKPISKVNNEEVESSDMKQMATPMRREIESGVDLKKTKKKLATPVRKAIEGGVELKATRRKMATPLRREIEDGMELKETKQKMSRMATPLRKEIEEGVELKALKKKMATPMRKEIEGGVALKTTKKKMATPLRKEIHEGVDLKQTIKKMATPMRKEIEEGVELKTLKKKMATPMREEIQGGVALRATKKKMATPMREEIRGGVALKATKKKMATPMREEIQGGVALRATKKKMATPMREEIRGGVALKATKKKMATPMRKAICAGVVLKATKKKLATPLQREIHTGVELKSLKKRLKTPVREEIRRVAAEARLRRSKRRLKTPLRHAIEGGTMLKRAMQKKGVAAPLGRVKMMDQIRANETRDGSEIVRSAATRKRAEIAGRKKLTAVRRLGKKKPAAASVAPVFQFTGASTPDIFSPQPKKRRIVEEKVMEEIEAGDVFEAGLFKTPRGQKNTAKIEANFHPGLFATPKKDVSGKGVSGTPILDGLARLMALPREKNSVAVPEENFEAGMFEVKEVKRSTRNCHVKEETVTTRVTRATSRKLATTEIPVSDPEPVKIENEISRGRRSKREANPGPVEVKTPRGRGRKKASVVETNPEPVEIEIPKEEEKKKATSVSARKTRGKKQPDVDPGVLEEEAPKLRRSARVRKRTALAQDVEALLAPKRSKKSRKRGRRHS